MRIDAIKLASAALFVALFAQGCATDPNTANVPSEQSGVDCSNAPEDLSRLEHEKTSTAERIEKGVTSIMPIGLVAASPGAGRDGTRPRRTPDICQPHRA